MSATSVTQTVSSWFSRLLSGDPHQIIGGTDDPYLLRWYVIPRNPLFNVYLHKFLRSDDDRALHDHPWWFVSLILKGGYTEVTENGRTARSGLIGGRYKGWDRTIAFRTAMFRHRVELWPEMRHMQFSDGTFSKLKTQVGVRPCWTLIITGRRSRTWGFWCKQRQPFLQRRVGDRFVPWQQWDEDAGCGES